jgi:hypothetical protein
MTLQLSNTTLLDTETFVTNIYKLTETPELLRYHIAIRSFDLPSNFVQKWFQNPI